jgi:hypothetical protein
MPCSVVEAHRHSGELKQQQARSDQQAAEDCGTRQQGGFTSWETVPFMVTQELNITCSQLTQTHL